MERHLTRRQLLQASTVAAGMIAAPSFVTRGTCDSVAADDIPLRILADRQAVQIGMQGVLAQLKDRNVRGMLTREFNLYLAGGEFSWQSPYSQWIPALRPSRDSFDFSATDQIVDFAMANNMKVMAEALIWGNELPTWLTQGSFSKEDLMAMLQNHVSTLVQRYSTDSRRMDYWIVVNQPVTDNLWAPKWKFWFDNLGFDYVTEMPFRWARDANPNATLILNENHNEDTSTDANRIVTTQLANLVQSLMKKGAPVDAIGMQMHLKGEQPVDLDGFRTNIKRYNDLGLKVFITEFDVDMNNVNASLDDKLAQQAKIYGDVLNAYLDMGGAVFSMWGENDKYSGTAANKPGSVPSPFSVETSPKPAYFAMRDVLQARQPS